jgi:hypothetical protein
MTNPLQAYQDTITTINNQLSILQKRKSMLAWLRFASMLLVIAAIWFALSKSQPLLFIVAVIFIVVFFYFLSNDLKNSATIENQKRLLEINETEVKVLQHHFTHLPDGSLLKPAQHDYANDLDIFGKASLYQYINRTTAEQSAQELADWLLTPAPPEMIMERQQAIKELTPLTAWRQQLQSTGTAHQLTIATEKRINEWLQQENKFQSTTWKAVSIIYPLITLTILVLFLTEIISLQWFTLSFVLFLVISSSVSKLVTPAYNQLSRIANEIETFSESLLHIENLSFNSSMLKQTQQSFSNGQQKASGILKRLNNILSRFDFRLNIVVFIPLNAFLLWDLQQIITLEKWKTTNNSSLHHWYKGLAVFETLSTLSTLSFNHPHWSFPLLHTDRGTFIAEELGHPLIPANKIVTNSFTTSGTGNINLITGSNMAGKSTFLRSIGVNIVLAMMGAPVCAKKLTLHATRVISTMRVNDNLEESTSTFYAELKKLKTIIDEVNKEENVFLLLDEILRGTNSLDRHTGSEALIKQLIRKKAVGLLATHDLELAKLVSQYPDHIINYHFDVQVSNEELYFDYQLKPGICQSLNASILMKKTGIEL